MTRLEFYRSLVILNSRSLRGDISSKNLMVVPVSEDEDTLQDLAGELFLEILLEYDLGRDDFLFFPLVLNGNKPGKSAVAPTLQFLQKFTRKQSPARFRRVILVGSDCFKQLIGRGKKPGNETLNGSIIYPEELDYLPTFSLPDIHFFVPLPTKDERDKWRQEQFRISYTKRYVGYIEKLKAFIAS